MKVRNSKGTDFEVPDFIWTPPAVWTDFQKIPATGTFTNKLPPKALADFEPAPNKDAGPSDGLDAKTVPHPLSDYGHIDPDTPFFGKNAAALKNAPGFKRLAAVYDHLLGQITTILNKFNGVTDQRDYDQVRDEYLDLVADLDDHEASGGVEPGRRGYGLIIKWFHLQPGFEIGSGNVAQIRSVNFVVKWNPHSSTSSVLVH